MLTALLTSAVSAVVRVTLVNLGDRVSHNQSTHLTIRDRATAVVLQ
jgi:hypothetical protein